MLASILFTIFAWILVGALIAGMLYWVVIGIVCLYHDIKETPSSGNGAADVIDNLLGSNKSYNIHIDITADKVRQP